MATVSSGFFNAAWYLSLNPDVAAAVQAGAVASAEEHFNNFGRFEGRSANPLFNPQDYLAANPDVAAAVEAGIITAHDHFIQFGASEGRSPLSLFDPDFYLTQNPDVAAAVEAGLMTATEHFLLYGQGEPRAINPLINLGDYMNANADLAEAAAQGVISPMVHLLSYGAAEGRDLGNGVNLGIFANDPAFQSAVAGGNLQAALERAGDVAPFLPTFQPPPGWAPPANTPIPMDFTPPAGTTLVIPPTVVVPPGTELPPSFEPVTPPAPTPPAPTPGGGGGGGDGATPTFTVTKGDAVAGKFPITFSGTATGDITFTVNEGIVSFTKGTTPATVQGGGTITWADVSKITVGTGQTLSATAAQVTGKTIDGAGNVAVTALTATADANLSLITNSGTKTATVSDNVTFTGNLGNFTTTVVADKTLTAAATVLDGKTVIGSGSVNVSALAADSNLSGLNTTLNVTANVPNNLNISANSNLGTVDAFAVANGTLTLTAAQADGKGLTGAGAVTITGSDGVQTINVASTGTNTIAGGKGGDQITLGAGADTVVVGGATAAVTETHALTFQNLIAGQSVTVDGLTLTATGAIAAADVAAGFASLTASANTGNTVVNGRARSLPIGVRVQIPVRP